MAHKTKHRSKKIIVCSNTGFCFGVKRALDIAKDALEKRKTVYSLGPIIHNPQVVDEFSQKGLKILRGIGKNIPSESALLIPSHGINLETLKNRKINRINTTCPLVERVQKIVRDLKEKGYFIIIVGDGKHPEVKGLKGIAGKNSRVLKSGKEAAAFKLKKNRIALISQTTVSLSDFKEVLTEIIKKNFTEIVSFNTVCKNTVNRQKEASKIARKVDAMVVIGGKNSANTTKIAGVCRKVNRSTFHIESEKDIRQRFLRDKRTIGIASGASTPPYAIRDVIKKIRRIDWK